MFSTDDERCPVKMLRFYLCKRPVHLRNSGPFYLGVKHNVAVDDKVWFISSPMGKNKISSIMKNMIKDTSINGTDRKITNHSGRKTSVKKMKRAALPEDSIIKITGHNNTVGLRAYDEGDLGEFRSLSTAFHNQQNAPSICSKLFPHQFQRLSRLAHFQCRLEIFQVFLLHPVQICFLTSTSHSQQTYKTTKGARSLSTMTLTPSRNNTVSTIRLLLFNKIFWF